MASYPFLYAASASLLHKLDPSKFKRTFELLDAMEENHITLFELPYDKEKDVMEWKEILSKLPSLIETLEFSQEGFLAISEFVYGFHAYLIEDTSGVDWFILHCHMKKFKDHYNLDEPLDSSPDSSPDRFPIKKSSSRAKLDKLLDTSLLSSLRVALSTLKAPDVKPLDDIPPQLLPCLAYCALYPQGSTFVRETLIYQWMAEGFLLEDRLEDDVSVSEQVKKGNFYFNKLLEKGVFVEPIFASGGRSSSDAYKRIHSCKIHPDIHSAVCRMASNEVFIIPGNKQGSAAPVLTRYVALHKEVNAEAQSYEFPFQPTTFMCFIPEINKVTLQSLLSKIEVLRVLHFAGTQFEELPRKLTALSNLGYLGLSRNPLLKSVDCCKFPKLKTLAVDECVHLEKVDASGKLEILQISHCSELKSFTLTSYNLEILRIYDCPLLKSLDCCKFPKLKTLVVDECVHLEKVDASGKLEILQISHCSELKSFTATSYNLEILRILECPRLEFIPSNGFYKLKELVCHNCDSLDLDLGECWGNPNYVEVVGLPKLIELKLGDSRSGSLLIANCSNLKSIDNHLQKSMNSLETLRIYDCPNLEISPKVLSSLIRLRSINVRNCPIIMNTTFSNEAIEDLAPCIWNKDRKFIIDRQPNLTDEQPNLTDGQPNLTQEVGLLEEVDAALGPLGTSSSAQTSSYVTIDSSYFKLVSESSKSTEDSKGIFDQEFRRKMFFTSINEIRKEHKIYCCLFPGDVEFERDTFVRLWMALGIFQEPLEFSGEECFEGLMNEGFIIDSRTDILTGMKKYKINVDNDKVKTFSNRVDNKDLYARLEDDQMAAVKTLSLPKCRHVSLVGQKINEKTFKTLEKTSELKTVLLIPDYGDSLKQIPSSFFEALTCMRTLDLSGSHISELPSSIGNMTQLHFLDLSFTLLERIPESIAGLGELQTLKLKGCKRLHALPKGMKQLRSLRHLDFDILGQLTSMPKGMGQLTQLRTLPAFIVSEEDGCSTVGELENLNKLGGSFCISGLECASVDDLRRANMEQKQLTGLHLKWNDSVSYDYVAGRNAHRVLMDICPAFESLKEFKISSYPGPIVAWWVKDSRFVNLARLELISCKIEMFEAPDTLPNLKYLNITDMNGVKIIHGLHQGQRSGRKISFPMLETLIIDGMLNLESWTNIEEGDFPHLTKLSLMYCPKLTQLDFLSFLHSLTYLEISHCESLASLSRKPLPTLLETLIINKCPALKEHHAPGKDDWDLIQHVQNIWIDMKGLGSANQDTDSDDSDYSDDETYHFNDSDKRTQIFFR